MKHTILLATIIGIFFLAKPALADGNNSGEIACTPVYGMADTCVEHTPIDTGAENSIAYSLAGSSYLAGLISFIKAKKLSN